MRYSLDSNIVIALMAQHPVVLKRTMRQTPGNVTLSSVVLHELMFGAFNSDRVTANLDRLSDLDFPVLSFDTDDARVAGEIRARLKRAGTPIGPFDVLIAGQSLARDITLVTANTREFARVEGLRVENWME